MNNIQSAPPSPMAAATTASPAGAVTAAANVGVGIKSARSNIFNVDGLPTQQMQQLSIDYSSIRGKDVLVQPTEAQLELLRRRLLDRIADSCGETIYEIGVGEGKFKRGFDKNSNWKGAGNESLKNSRTHNFTTISNSSLHLQMAATVDLIGSSLMPLWRRCVNWLRP